MIKSIKIGMDRFFFEQAIARKIVYVSILLAWLILALSTASSLTFKKVIIATVGCPLVGAISYYFNGFSMAFIWLFSNKLEIYQFMYWFWLFIVAVSLWSIPNPEMQESSLMVIVGLAAAWSARSIYFNYRDRNKKKN